MQTVTVSPKFQVVIPKEMRESLKLAPGQKVQALLIQSGGAPETLAALLAGSLDAAALNPPADAQALARGLHYVIFGPDLRLPYAATVFFTRRSLVAKRQPVLGQFVRAMAEAGKIIHTDKEFVYKVMGKYLRLSDRKILDAAYNGEVKVLERKLQMNDEGFQSIWMKFPELTRGPKSSRPKTSSIGASWTKWKRAASSTSFGERVNSLHSYMQLGGPAKAG